MSDIIERAHAYLAGEIETSTVLIAEMAAEIERLEAKCVQTDRYIALLNDEIADNGRLRDKIERLTAALTGIAVMDVYTRPGEQQASEVMRDCAKAALGSRE